MTRSDLFSFLCIACAFIFFTSAPDCVQAQNSFDPGTEEDREALFDYLLETTMEWDAFASLPNHPVHREHPAGIDVKQRMLQYRDDLINADTAEEMWLVLHKLSNTRMDRHLNVSTVEGGLEVPDHMRQNVAAPIRFIVDYEDLDNRFFFVSDLAENIGDYVDGPAPALGDKLVSVNDMSGQEYIDAIRPYWRYSSENRLWRRVSEIIGEKRSHVPHDIFYEENLRLELEREDGSRYELELPYLDPDEIDWQQYQDLDHLDWGRYMPREYPGFTRDPEFDQFETFNFYTAEDEDLSVVLLQWYGFRGDLPDAMDHLMEYADEHDLLDSDVIVDATRSRGGSNGAYALARLQPEKFRTTKHNLKVSEGMERWVNDRLEDWDPSPSRGQDPTNIKEWFETDAQKAIEEDRYYTNDVPFKGVQPKWADATINPAEKHFKGDLVVWMSMRGGSHLDQFAAQVVDNDLGHMMGMASGGFSNSWSTSEVLRFPTTGEPIVEYEWSLGHSIRPNGEILQYNPAQPHEYIPQTRENYFEYHTMLLERSLERLGHEQLAQ